MSFGNINNSWKKRNKKEKFYINPKGIAIAARFGHRFISKKDC